MCMQHGWFSYVFTGVVCAGSIRFILGVRLVLACWHRRTPVSWGRDWTQIKQDDRHINARKQNLDMFNQSIHQRLYNINIYHLDPPERQLSTLSYAEFVNTMKIANHDDCSLRTLLSIHIFCPYLRRSIYASLYIQILDTFPPSTTP